MHFISDIDIEYIKLDNVKRGITLLVVSKYEIQYDAQYDHALIFESCSF